jgi:hypothetical protein
MGSRYKINKNFMNQPGPGSYDISKSDKIITQGGTGIKSGAKWGFPK